MTAPDVRALSLRQPWADAVISGGKRIENRVRWVIDGKSRGPVNFRGPFLIHAARGMTWAEYVDVVGFVERRGLAWRPPPFEACARGGIVGRARVDGVIRVERDFAAYAANVSGGEGQRSWWMGGFALVLADVEPLPFVPCVGSLGFFYVPPDVVAKVSP